MTILREKKSIKIINFLQKGKNIHGLNEAIGSSFRELQFVIINNTVNPFISIVYIYIHNTTIITKK